MQASRSLKKEMYDLLQEEGSLGVAEISNKLDISVATVMYIICYENDDDFEYSEGVTSLKNKQG